MSLPLLNFTAKLFDKTDLSNVLLIAVQHMLKTNVDMFESLFQKGLKPENTFLLGKCYSTNNQVMQDFQKQGIFVHPGSNEFNSHLSFDTSFDANIADLLKHIKKTVNLQNYTKVLLLDDGGHLIDVANEILPDITNVVGVEQTSSGHYRLQAIPLKFPVINVARSQAKLLYESPFIAEIIVQTLLKKIKQHQLSPSRVLIIGAGAIGTEISHLLKNTFDTHCYDIKNHISDFGTSELKNILPNFDIIIGAVGQEVINTKLQKILQPNTILVSASSSDREFSAVILRKQLPITHNCHDDLYINSLWLFNCGFPLNFNGAQHSVPAEKIQLTRALMFAGLCSAMETASDIKMTPLSNSLQQKIIKEFHKY